MARIAFTVLVALAVLVSTSSAISVRERVNVRARQAPAAPQQAPAPAPAAPAPAAPQEQPAPAPQAPAKPPPAPEAPAPVPPAQPVKPPPTENVPPAQPAQPPAAPPQKPAPEAPRKIYHRDVNRTQSIYSVPRVHLKNQTRRYAEDADYPVSKKDDDRTEVFSTDEKPPQYRAWAVRSAPNVTAADKTKIAKFIAKLENKNFSAGELFTVAEKVQAYRELFDNVTKDINAVTATLKWHEDHVDNTRYFLREAQDRVRHLRFKLSLLNVTAVSLKGQLSEMQHRIEAAKGAPITFTEDLLHEDLKNFGHSPLDKEKTRVTLVVQESAKQLANAYAKLYKHMQTIMAKIGRKFSLDESPAPGFLDAVDTINSELRDLDRDIKERTTHATKMLGKAVAARMHQMIAYNKILKLRKEVSDNEKRLTNAQALYLNAKKAYQAIENVDLPSA